MGKKGSVYENNNIKDEFNVDSLREDIKSENIFIKNLVDSIPPEIYFASDTVDELKQEKFLQADQKLNGIQLKRKGKELSKKAKHKRAKLDPQLKWTISSIHQEMVKNKKENAATLDKRDLKPAVCQSFTREDLKQRLHDKINALRGKPTSTVVLAEEIEKKREKRRLSKLKMKERRKKSKVNVVKEDKPKLSKKIKDSKKLVDAKSIVFNKEKSMVFNKFEFTDNENAEKIKGELSGKNYKQLIKKVERKEEKLKQLEATDKDKASIVKEKTQWKTVLSRAEGIKVKDSLPLLKKSLSKQNQRKKSSGKKWQDREDTVQKKQDARQKKRTDNIKARKQEKIKKKIKRSIKKGRMIPGITNI